MAKAKTEKPATGQYVCGRPVEEIRKAYFDGELNKLCAGIMAEGTVGPEGLAALAAELGGMKIEEAEFRAKLEEAAGGGLFTSSARPPSVEELQKKLSEEDQLTFTKWRKFAEESVARAREIIGRHANMAMAGKPMAREKLMDDAHAMNGLMLYVEEYRDHLRAVWRARVFEMQDQRGISRKEAEERSEITPEYADYRRMAGLSDRCDNLIMNCKKEYGDKFS
jgi:hypothetical protein